MNKGWITFFETQNQTNELNEKNEHIVSQFIKGKNAISMIEFMEDIKKIENKWQSIWQDNNLFVPEIDRTKEKFFFTVAYPYANGSLHVGHCRTYVLGDIFARYRRQTGFNVLWPMGWHITGTPVLAVASKIEHGDKDTIDLYTDYVQTYEDKKDIQKVLKSFTDPMNIAMYFSSKISDDFLKMGFSIDFTRQFTTADKYYNKFVEWQFIRLNRLGYITKGNYPILYCLNDKNAVGEDDIKDGDINKVEITELIMVKFEYDGKYIVSSTLRPDTIFGVTNIWIKPDEEYVEMSVDNETWIVSKSALIKLQNQIHNPVIQSTFQGSELVGKFVINPITSEKIPILPCDYINAKFGTGIVYSVPGHSIFDYMALKQLQNNQKSPETEIIKDIKPIILIDYEKSYTNTMESIIKDYKIKSLRNSKKIKEATQFAYKNDFYHGTYNHNSSILEGKTIEQGKSTIIKLLQKKSKTSLIFYETSISSYCRCGGEIIVAIFENQYFLNYGNPEWKSKAYEALNSMEIYPSKYRNNFEKTFDWLDKRPCVRKRGLGTEFPFTKGEGWIIESLSDSTIYMAFYTIIKEIKNKKITADQLKPEFFDFVFSSIGDLNVVSKATSISVNDISIIKDNFEYWYPNDLRHTAIAHLSNHLSFAIFHHVALFDKKYWIKAYSINEMLIRNGEKMGKSKGNVIPIAQIPSKYGVDLTRLYLASAAAADSTVDFKDNEIKSHGNQFTNFISICNEVVEITNNKLNSNGWSFYSKVFISVILKLFRDALEEINQYNIREYIIQSYFNVLNFIDQFKSNITLFSSEMEFYAAIRYIMEYWIPILAPIIPHNCEEIWHKMGKVTFVSMSQIPDRNELYLNSSDKDNDLIHSLNYIQNIENDISKIISVAKLNPNKINIYIAPGWKYKLVKILPNFVNNGHLNIGNAVSQIKEDEIFKDKISEVSTFIKEISKNVAFIFQDFNEADKEFEYLFNFKEYFMRKFDCKIKIHESDSKPSIQDNNSKRALPNRPAIFIE